MVKFEEVTYKSFGRCISMSNGRVELLATLDFGPRIIRFSKIGGENVMLEDAGTLEPGKFTAVTVSGRVRRPCPAPIIPTLSRWRIRRRAAA